MWKDQDLSHLKLSVYYFKPSIPCCTTNTVLQAAPVPLKAPQPPLGIPWKTTCAPRDTSSVPNFITWNSFQYSSWLLMRQQCGTGRESWASGAEMLGGPWCRGQGFRERILRRSQGFEEGVLGRQGFWEWAAMRGEGR